MMRIPMRRMAHLAVALALVSGPAIAQPPSVDDLVAQLQPPPDRGLALTRGVRVEGTPALPPPSVALDITFAFNSAALTTDAMLILDNLGRALNDPRLAASRFELAGHTDAVGGDAYNLRLSQRRAAAVRRYLMARHGVDGKRLDSIGYGRAHLVDPDHPDGAVNRRVQVTNLGE
jgi:outer membrane protein OmpA-like peptidoglycan-associated protein